MGVPVHASRAGASFSRAPAGPHTPTVNSFETGSGQTGSSRKCRDFPKSAFIGKCRQNDAKRGSKVWQHVRKIYGIRGPSAKTPFVPNPGLHATVGFSRSHCRAAPPKSPSRPPSPSPVIYIYICICIERDIDR